MTKLRIFWTLQLAAIRSSMQYRVNFIVMSVFAIVYQSSGFVFIWAALEKFHVVAGWTFGEVAFLYALRLVAHTLWRIPSSRITSLAFVIREGHFDRYLVRPFNPLLQLMTRGFFMGTVGDIVTAIVAMVVAARVAPISWTPWHVVYLLLAAIGGALIEGAFVLAAVSTGFKALQTWAAEFLVDNGFLMFGSYPLRLFGGGLAWFLTWIVPVAFVAYLPSAVLLDRSGGLSVSAAVAYAAPAAGFVWFAAAYAYWTRQLRNYQGAGS